MDFREWEKLRGPWARLPETQYFLRQLRHRAESNSGDALRALNLPARYEEALVSRGVAREVDKIADEIHHWSEDSLGPDAPSPEAP